MITDHAYTAFTTRDGSRACRFCYGTVDSHAFGKDECPGHGRDGTRDPCCNRVGEYNGFDSGPLIFVCPNHCSCHD